MIALTSGLVAGGTAMPGVTFVSWLVTALLGGHMLRTWVASGGLRRRRATGDGPPPPVVFGHFALAVTGLAVWGGYAVTGWTPLAWAGGSLLMPVVGLGISTLTLWTPYPAPGPAAAGPPPQAVASATSGMLATPAEDTLARGLSDDVLAKALTDEALAGRLADMVIAGSRPQPPAPGRRPSGHLAALVPVAHGVAAVTTVLLVMVTIAQMA